MDKYSTDPREQCVDDMELENLKSTLNVTEVFHVSAKTGYQVNHSMELLEQIVSPLLDRAVSIQYHKK